MKTSVYLSDFRDAFRAMGRDDQFSYEGLEILFDFLEEMEQGTGEEYELDVIALCCEFYESSPEEAAENYGLDLSDCDDDEERMQSVLDYLNEHTMVAGNTDGSIIYQAF